MKQLNDLLPKRTPDIWYVFCSLMQKYCIFMTKPGAEDWKYVVIYNIKLGEEEGGGGGDLWSYGVLSSQVTVPRDGAPLAWRWLNTCLPKGSSQWIPHSAFLACTALPLLTKLPLSQYMVQIQFTILIPGLVSAGCCACHRACLPPGEREPHAC